MNRKLLLLVIVMLAAVALPARWATAEPAATSTSFIPGEPNDTFATANDAYEGYLMTPTDVDFLRLELEESTWIRLGVEINRGWDTPPLLRVEIAVFDSAHTLLAEDTDCDEVVRTPAIEAAAGLYYLRVRACNGYFDSDQVYYVIDETFEAFEREPNDSFASAHLIGSSSSTWGYFSTANDLDTYRLEFPSATLLSYYVSSNSYSLEAELALYDAAHALLAEDADCDYSTELETPVGPGTYFLSVKPCAGTLANSDLYVLHVYGQPLEVEPNDSFATATPQTLGGYYESYVLGFLPTPADRDYYRFDVPIPIRFSPGVHFGDVTLALYDVAYTELARGDLSLYLTPGTYYLLVEPEAGTETDLAYKLNFFWRRYEVEPNNSLATATALSTSVDEDHIAGDIQPAGDVDFYRFEGQARTRLHAGLSASGSTMVPEIALLAADGTILANHSEPTCLSLCYVSFEYDLSTDATYYLRVRSVTHPVGVGDYSVGIRVSPYWTTDQEPNDTPAQAVPIEYGQILAGDFSDTDVVDYYRFEGQAGDQIAIAPTDTYGIGWADFTLYDPAMNPVTLNATDWPVRWGTLPVTGTYWLAFRDYDYYRAVYLTGGDEPNNTLATATDIPFGPTLDAHYDYPCDTDWYRFQGRAGDVLATINTAVVDENIYLYAADGTYMPGHVLPADGIYYLSVLGETSDKWDNYCDDRPQTIPFAEALWVSAAVDGLGGNAAIKQGDIVTRKNAANQWQIVFDASDVGIIKNVVAFERMPNGSILLSLAAAQTVPGLGQVMPHDIIRFLPSSLGDNTAGTFAWYLDGSDVGLTTTGEKIDAIAMQPEFDNPLRISTTGAGAVPRQSGGTLKFADEDMINFVGTAYGATSAGKWRLNLDGSAVPGMAVEDITAATRVEVEPARDSQPLLSFDSAFTIKGTRGTFRDVMNEGTWLPAVQNLTDKKIDGLAIGPAWLP